MKPRPLKIVGDIAYVPLTKGYTTIIDAEDAELVGQYNWQAKEVRENKVGGRIVKIYARCSGKFNMHQLVLPIPEGYEVDHEDGDGLNNRKSNLRQATTEQNRWNVGLRSDNTSGVKGVHLCKKTKEWIATISVKGKQKFLGTHKTLDSAIFARKEAENLYRDVFHKKT